MKILSSKTYFQNYLQDKVYMLWRLLRGRKFHSHKPLGRSFRSLDTGVPYHSWYKQKPPFQSTFQQDTLQEWQWWCCHIYNLQDNHCMKWLLHCCIWWCHKAFRWRLCRNAPQYTGRNLMHQRSCGDLDKMANI